MAISTKPLAPWKQRARQVLDYRTCEFGPWAAWAPLRFPGSAAVTTGQEFIPDYRAPFKGNHIDALPYVSSLTTFDVPEWQATCSQNNGTCRGGYEYEGDGRSFTAITRSTLQNVPRATAAEKKFVNDLAMMKAQASLRKADASIPMMLRERVETINMLKSYAGRSLDLIRRRQLADVKRWKRLKKAPSEQRKFLAQTIANEHLMFVFGMLPLIDDMVGLADFVTRDKHTFIKGRGRMTVKKSGSVPRVEDFGFTSVSRMESLYSVRVSLRADITVSVLANAQRLGFNPLYTLYDFTPLSFVVGFFSNFNYWIQSLDPLLGSEFRSGSISARELNSVSVSTYATPTNIYTSKGSGHSSASLRTDTRTTVSSMPPQGDLAFYNNFSFFSVTASASLFLQRKLKLTKQAIKVKSFRYKSKKPVTLPPIKYTGS